MICVVLTPYKITQTYKLNETISWLHFSLWNNGISLGGIHVSISQQPLALDEAEWWVVAGLTNGN
jgi:hypothetical protein